MQKDTDMDKVIRTEYIYNYLKEKIFGWELSPEKKINIDQLSRELNVSPIPLREVLSRLHSEKLVIFEPNKGYRVSGVLDDKRMTDMLETRILIETQAVRSVIRSGRLQVLDEMVPLTERISAIRMGGSYKEVLEFNQLDQQFHYLMVNAAGNSFLTDAYVGMHCHLHIARFYHMRGEVDQQEASAEHQDIIEAIRLRDIYRAEEAVINHIKDAKSRLFEKRIH
ncbi:GntR family transcriptional regulator [Paenibacillus thalictri]|uniref:GntR family transcriptional regulator n=1 Tax=Paenibacillus thalictri TaxID=2527873 RepID=A0A4Q9DNX8_9BACL|nr:GntR family transcriptional regulator [Paenibacillus thalictri]TBL75675.1 GntR family transcriptional regulator [Paenibacillus thalictri]